MSGLSPDMSYYNVSTGEIPYTPPPDGVWYFTLLLTEYLAAQTDGGYSACDGISSSTPVTIGPSQPQAGQLQMPSPVIFPAQQVGTQSGPISATITNIGGSPVTVSGVNGTDLGEFPGTTNCLGTIAAGGSCQVTFSFLPNAVGVRNETITIVSDGVGSPQSFTVSGTGSSATASANYTGLWWNSPAGSESGWGINFEHQGNIIFATWFTYDRTGTAWWLSMTANETSDNTFSGTLYQTNGPAFNAVPFNPAAVTATPVGTGTLTFSDGNDGTFAYTVNGISQTKAITHQAFGPLPTCVWDAQPDLALATNVSGLWWAAPAGLESGWGVNFSQQGNIIFATWFTYNFDGSPLWLSATADNTAPGVYTGALYQTMGPPFEAAFPPGSVSEAPIGTATFSFTNGNSGTFSYTVNATTGPVTQTKPITQQVFATAGTACQ